MFSFLKEKKNIFRILLCLYFAYLLWSRLAYLNADSPAYWIDVEERTNAYNARNEVLFGDSSSGGEHYEPMVSSPLPAVISYLSFLLMGVSLFSLRLPYALMSLLTIFIFYKVLKKEMNPLAAFLGIVFWGSACFTVFLNRSALVENLFILLPVVSLFCFQEYVDREKEESLFLFGLFSSMNILVKYNGVYFLLVSAVGALMASFRKGRSLSAALRSCGHYAAGVTPNLVLLVVAAGSGIGNGALETILKGQCAAQIVGGKDFENNVREFLLFFTTYFPFISLAAFTGVSSMLFMRLRKLSKVDVFVMTWWILGAVISFSSRISFKRLIFLLIPVVYVAVRGGYGMWEHLKVSGSQNDQGINGRFESCKGVVPCILKMILGCGFAALISWGAEYILLEHGEMAYNFIPISIFLKIPMAQAGWISVLTFLALTVPPVASAGFCFIKAKDYSLAFATLKRWFVGALLFFLIAVSILSIVTNEASNGRFLYYSQNRKYESSQCSRDLGRTVKSATIVGSEMAFRLLGFENRCKFLFNHDGVNLRGRDYHALDYDSIIRRRDVRYFCIALPNNSNDIEEFRSNIKKIKLVYPAMVRLRIYRVKEAFFFIYDKYPSGRS